MKPLAVLLVSLCAACASNPPPAQESAPDRIRCIPVGQIPGTAWWSYICTFEGDTLTLPAIPEPTTA